MSLSSRPDLEEERRLFYVALTRAQKEVQLSYAASRYKWGNLIYCEPSRFIEEIDDEFLDFAEPEEENDTFASARSSFFGAGNNSFNSNPNFRKGNSMKSVNKGKVEKVANKVIPPHKKMVQIDQAKREIDPSFAANVGKIEAGMRVEHLRFGKGEVKSTEGNEPNKKAIIVFDKVGEKQLLLKFAKLRILR